MDLVAFSEQRFASWTWRDLGMAFGIAAALMAIFSFASANWFGELRARTESGGREPGVVSHMLDARDPRGYINPAGQKPASGAYHLAVVVDSSFYTADAPQDHSYRGQKRYLLTPLIARHRAAIGGRPVVLHEYFQLSSRMFDRRQSILRAISDPEIDAVVISVNPFMLFNDWMAFEYSQHRSKMLTLDGLESSDYRGLAMSLRPGTLLMDAASAISPLHELRAPVSGVQSRHLRATFPANPPFPRYKPAEPGIPHMIVKWFEWFYPLDIQAAINLNSATSLYGACLATSSVSSTTIGSQAFRASLRSLKAWGKPVILYVPPIDPAFRKDAGWPLLLEINRQIDMMVQQANATSIRLESNSVAASFEDVVYFDPYHMRVADGFVRYFAGMMERNLGLQVTRRPFEHLLGGPFRTKAAAATVPLPATGISRERTLRPGK
jgi:hypothetical protein